MFLPVLEYIHIPFDEEEAANFLLHLVEQSPEIACKVERMHAVTSSSRAVLEALTEDGIFAGRISDDEARYYDDEISRYEAEAGKGLR